MAIEGMLYGIFADKEKEEVLPPRAREAVELLKRGYKIPEIASTMGITRDIVLYYLRLGVEARAITDEEYSRAYVPNWLWEFVKPVPTWRCFDWVAYRKQLGILLLYPFSQKIKQQSVREGLIKLLTGEGHIGIEKHSLSPVLELVSAEKEIANWFSELVGTTTYQEERVIIEKPRVIGFIFHGDINGIKVTAICHDWDRFLGFRRHVAKWIYGEVGFKATSEQFDEFMEKWGWAVRKRKARILVPRGSKSGELGYVEVEGELYAIPPLREIG